MTDELQVRPEASLLDGLTWGSFPDHQALLKETFAKIERSGGHHDVAILAAANCLQQIWTIYSNPEIAEIIAGFHPVQAGLFGLEYDESGSHRYRDHILHMLNVFIMGA